jgi:hypothetical protein
MGKPVVSVLASTMCPPVCAPMVARDVNNPVAA